MEIVGPTTPLELCVRIMFLLFCISLQCAFSSNHGMAKKNVLRPNILVKIAQSKGFPVVGAGGLVCQNENNWRFSIIKMNDKSSFCWFEMVSWLMLLSLFLLSLSSLFLARALLLQMYGYRYFVVHYSNFATWTPFVPLVFRIHTHTQTVNFLSFSYFRNALFSLRFTFKYQF